MTEARKDDWRSRIRPDSPKERVPNVKVEPIAAGEKVVASRRSQVYQYLREYYDDAIAVEMEGFGFLKATQQTKAVSAIVIRGISDLIDGKNDDGIEPESIRKDRAARHASAFAFEILAKFNGASQSPQIGEKTDFVQVNRDQTLPEYLISFSIEAMDQDVFLVRAHHGQQTLLERGQLAPRLIKLSQVIESETSPQNLVSTLDTCNAELQDHETCPIGQFLKWVPSQLTSIDQERACLTIDDRADLNTPWELLEVGEQPIGAVVQTIYQSPHIQTQTCTEWVEQCCQGHVLAYTTAQDHPWQDGFFYRHHAVFSDFLGDIQQPQTDYGLVYINGFGIQESLGLNPTAFIRRSNVFRNRSGLVFVNGQLCFEESIAMSHSQFLSLFLRYGASGVIGVLRPIEATLARQVVDTFFAWFQAQNQNCRFSIPAILKSMRQQAHERLNQEVLTDDTSAFYLATFLYIYYGNPLMTLQLTPANP